MNTNTHTVLNNDELNLIANMATTAPVLLLPAPTAEELITAQAVIEAPAETQAPKKSLRLSRASLAKLVAAVTEDERAVMMKDIAVELDERATHELLVAPTNNSMQDTLKKLRTKLVLPGIAGLMVATEVNPVVFNRSISANKRFNVYNIQKLEDLLHGLNGSGGFKNAINVAVMKSLFKFRAAGVPFTGVAAQAAVSDKIVVDAQMKALLIRHTVDAGTAPTQASSTMNALETLGVVSNTGTRKAQNWVLTDAPVTKVLEKVFGEAKAA